LGRPRSLRARLAIAYTGIVTVLVVIVLVATHAIVEQALIDSTAARLEIEAGLIASQSTAGRGVTATDLAAGELAGVLGGQQTGVVILDGEGRLLASQANGAPMTVVEARLASGDYATIARTGMSTTSVVPTDAGDVLVIAVPVRLRSGNGPPAGHGRPADKGPPPGRGL